MGVQCDISIHVTTDSEQIRASSTTTTSDIHNNQDTQPGQVLVVRLQCIAGEPTVYVTRTELEVIMINEISQTQRDKYHMCSLSL